VARLPGFDVLLDLLFDDLVVCHSVYCRPSSAFRSGCSRDTRSALSPPS
jgi:hypothetical protein